MKKILVVDDEPLLLDLLGHLLTRIGYQADRAHDSREAAGRLKDREYDLIFLDIKMPLMSGKEFYLKIKEHLPQTASRIVFLTADVSNAETLTFIKRTGNLYLRKPFTIKEVGGLLQKFFQTSIPLRPPEDHRSQLFG